MTDIFILTRIKNCLLLVVIITNQTQQHKSSYLLQVKWSNYYSLDPWCWLCKDEDNWVEEMYNPPPSNSSHPRLGLLVNILYLWAVRIQIFTLRNKHHDCPITPYHVAYHKNTTEKYHTHITAIFPKNYHHHHNSCPAIHYHTNATITVPPYTPIPYQRRATIALQTWGNMWQSDIVGLLGYQSVWWQ